MSFEGVSSSVVRELFLRRLSEVGSVTVVAREMGLSPNTGSVWARRAGIASVRVAHPGRAEFARLRAEGKSRREAAVAVGIHERTAKDWDRGVRRTMNARIYPDGRRVDYSTGQTTMGVVKPVVDVVPAVVGARLLSLLERERIADLRRAGLSLRAIGRELGRPASTVMRELHARTDANGRYLPHAAHRDAAAKRVRPKPAKLAQPGRLREYVA
ncbi:helix-turn-helix domain-containing protein, partial [Microbacterium sp. Kw_RZR3]